VKQLSTLSARELARCLNRSVETLERWRRLRVGPPYYRLQGRVTYDPIDVAVWLEEQKRMGARS